MAKEKDTNVSHPGIMDVKLPNLLEAHDISLPQNPEASFDVNQSVELVKRAMRQVNDRIVGRERLVEQTLLALISREHQLIYSRTGTAKTLYGQSVLSQFDGEPFFIQFTRGTTEEAVVGAYDLKEFKKGRIWHRTQNSLVTADLAFLDEFLDANDMVLRAVLGILNERKFTRGEQIEDARLHSAIAVTNYMRQSEMAEAVIDRFLFQARIEPESTPLNELLIDRVYSRFNGKVVRPLRPIPMDALRSLSAIVKGEDKDRAITASYAILFLKNQIIKNYVRLSNQNREAENKGDGLYISPRTIAKARDVINASALLNHRDHIEGEDLYALRFILTTISGNDSKVAEEEELFLRAASETLEAFPPRILKIVEDIMIIDEFYELYRSGSKVEARGPRRGILRSFLNFSGAKNWSEVTTETFLKALASIEVDSEVVGVMRDELAERIKSQI